jgi:conjugative relaxase-like TrwC/TraI family protein
MPTILRTIIMLSIGAMLSGQYRYYINLALEDYYTRPSAEPEGFWLGSGAAKLGLHGKVDKETLHALFEGFSPEGVALVKNAGKMTGTRPRQPGWDLTWSVPKSVSVLWASASPQDRKTIEEGVRQAVEKVIEYIEKELAFCRAGRRGTMRCPGFGGHSNCLILSVRACERITFTNWYW